MLTYVGGPKRADVIHGWSLLNCICSSYPRFTIIEYISFMGWIKVAETLINPFGEDDEDFQINYLIDRNVHVSYMLVDDADMEMEMAKDPFLEAGITIPAELPYKDESQR